MGWEGRGDYSDKERHDYLLSSLMTSDAEDGADWRRKKKKT